MERTRIKICGLTRLEDVQAAVRLGVDALGFVFFEPSSRHLEAGIASDLVDQVPAFVTRTALFMNAQPTYVDAILSKVSVDLLQFHGQESGVFCRAFGRPYIKAVPMGALLADAPADAVLQDRLAAYFDEFFDARGFLLDSNALGQAGGSGEAFDWSQVGVLSGRPIVLAGGLRPDNVAAAITAMRPFAVDVSSGVESAPGCKDLGLMRALVAAVSSVT